jgi:DNA-binding NarL/FixJ family response regulator
VGPLGGRLLDDAGIGALPSGRWFAFYLRGRLTDLYQQRTNPATAAVRFARIRQDHPRTQVVVLTTFADDDALLAALNAGAIGFLTKDAGRAEIARALHTAAAGQAVLDPGVYARLLARATTPPSPPPAPQPPAVTVLPDGLTAREAEVLTLIADGLTNIQIAHRLYVSETTIKTHINHIFTKARLRDRAEPPRSLRTPDPIGS